MSAASVLILFVILQQFLKFAVAIRSILGAILLVVGAVWGVAALVSGGDIVMPGIMVVAGGMAVAVETARRRPGSIDD